MPASKKPPAKSNKRSPFKANPVPSSSGTSGVGVQKGRKAGKEINHSNCQPSPGKICKKDTKDGKGRPKKSSRDQENDGGKNNTAVTGSTRLEVKSGYDFNCRRSKCLLDVLTGVTGGGGRLNMSSVVEKHARNSVMEQVKQFGVFKSVVPFGRRITCLAWHPSEPTVCAAGSKGGSVIIWNYNCDQFESILDTDYPGGSIQHMKFDINNLRRLYTCSIDGTFAARNFREGGGDETADVFLDTGVNRCDNWYTSFDVSSSGLGMLVGSNLGHVTLMSDDGTDKIWSHKLHKGKVSHIGFSAREPWLFVTASIDHSVKVWDIRTLGDGQEKMKGSNAVSQKFLQCLPHDKGVNNAEFSILDGTRLLTTDQHSQLRVYRSPNWTLENVLPHPHRQFQHITPIKASWHPLVDIAVAGRYPDNNFPGTLPGELRSVDLFDPESGEILHQLVEPHMNLIMSLNRFSPSGDALLSCAGRSALIWKRRPEDGKAKYYLNKATNEAYSVEEWPGFKPPANSRGKNKKSVR